jgi:hypothetical protein
METMNTEQQRIAIAEACGWTFINQVDKHPHGLPPDGRKDRYTSPLPDYLNDLNAMHKAEKVLESNQEQSYFELLHDIAGNLNFYRATAAQRAEAFLKTLNLWKP